MMGKPRGEEDEEDKRLLCCAREGLSSPIALLAINW